MEYGCSIFTQKIYCYMSQKYDIDTGNRNATVETVKYQDEHKHKHSPCNFDTEKCTDSVFASVVIQILLRRKI